MEDYWSILCCIIGSIGWRNPEETATFEEEKNIFSWWECTISHFEHSTGKKHELGFKSLPRPPYSPDLAPSDSYLFSNPKRLLRGRRFKSKEEVEWVTEGYFGGFDKSYYLKGIEKLKDRWTLCIELKGDKNRFLPKKQIFVHFITTISNALVRVLHAGNIFK